MRRRALPGLSSGTSGGDNRNPAAQVSALAQSGLARVSAVFFFEWILMVFLYCIQSSIQHHFTPGMSGYSAMLMSCAGLAPVSLTLIQLPRPKEPRVDCNHPLVALHPSKWAHSNGDKSHSASPAECDSLSYFDRRFCPALRLLLAASRCRDPASPGGTAFIIQPQQQPITLLTALSTPRPRHLLLYSPAFCLHNLPYATRDAVAAHRTNRIPCSNCRGVCDTLQFSLGMAFCDTLQFSLGMAFWLGASLQPVPCLHMPPPPIASLHQPPSLVVLSCWLQLGHAVVFGMRCLPPRSSWVCVLDGSSTLFLPSSSPPSQIAVWRSTISGLHKSAVHGIPLSTEPYPLTPRPSDPPFPSRPVKVRGLTSWVVSASRYLFNSRGSSNRLPLYLQNPSYLSSQSPWRYVATRAGAATCSDAFVVTEPYAPCLCARTPHSRCRGVCATLLGVYRCYQRSCGAVSTPIASSHPPCLVLLPDDCLAAKHWLPYATVEVHGSWFFITTPCLPIKVAADVTLSAAQRGVAQVPSPTSPFPLLTVSINTVLLPIVALAVTISVIGWLWFLGRYYTVIGWLWFLGRYYTGTFSGLWTGNTFAAKRLYDLIFGNREIARTPRAWSSLTPCTQFWGLVPHATQHHFSRSMVFLFIIWINATAATSSQPRPSHATSPALGCETPGILTGFWQHLLHTGITSGITVGGHLLFKYLTSINVAAAVHAHFTSACLFCRLHVLTAFYHLVCTPARSISSFARITRCALQPIAHLGVMRSIAIIACCIAGFAQCYMLV